MGDPLEPFRSKAVEEEVAEGGEAHDLLLFEYGERVHGIRAASVDAVVAHQPPAPLPATVQAVAGVVQDRGRVVVVLRSPTGAPEDAGVVRRLLICRTERGFVGLPCSTTRQVGRVVVNEPLTPGKLLDSSEGPILFVDPHHLVESLRGERC